MNSEQKRLVSALETMGFKKVSDGIWELKREGDKIAVSLSLIETTIKRYVDGETVFSATFSENEELYMPPLDFLNAMGIRVEKSLDIEEFLRSRHWAPSKGNTHYEHPLKDFKILNIKKLSSVMYEFNFKDLADSLNDIRFKAKLVDNVSYEALHQMFKWNGML